MDLNWVNSLLFQSFDILLFCLFEVCWKMIRKKMEGLGLIKPPSPHTWKLIGKIKWKPFTASGEGNSLNFCFVSGWQNLRWIFEKWCKKKHFNFVTTIFEMHPPEFSHPSMRSKTMVSTKFNVKWTDRNSKEKCSNLRSAERFG